MLRPRAVRTLLVEEIAALRPHRAAPSPGDEDREPAGDPGLEDREPASPEERHTRERVLEELALEKARRRALGVVILDLFALALLFLLRDATVPFLHFGPTIDTVFTVAVIAVAVHAGFRWAQFEQLKTVERVYQELE